MKLNLVINNNNVIYEHPFHLVAPSIFPFLTSIYCLSLTLSAVAYMHYFISGFYLLIFSLISTAIIMFAWWWEVVTEATFEGYHTKAVQRGLRYGIILFIISEIMFFFGFFWAFFHSSLSPAIQIGGIWPPEYIQVLSPWGLPFLNTLILLLSGAMVTWGHYILCIPSTSIEKIKRQLNYVILNLNIFFSNVSEGYTSSFLTNFYYNSLYILYKLITFSIFTLYPYIDPYDGSWECYETQVRVKEIILRRLIILHWHINMYVLWREFQIFIALGFTIILGISFLYFQSIEYIEAPFSLSDSVYGSVFFMLTGFHGFHVFIGTVFLFVCWLRFIKGHFIYDHHIGLEAAIHYWHFVDVVWLFLFVALYWWGGN